MQLEQSIQEREVEIQGEVRAKSLVLQRLHSQLKGLQSQDGREDADDSTSQAYQCYYQTKLFEWNYKSTGRKIQLTAVVQPRNFYVSDDPLRSIA